MKMKTDKNLMGGKSISYLLAAIICVATVALPLYGGEFWHGNGDGYWESNNGAGDNDNWESGNGTGYFFNKAAYGTKTVKFRSKVSIGSKVSIEGANNCTTDADPIVFLADEDDYGFTTTKEIAAGSWKLGNLWIKRGTFQCAALQVGNADNTANLPLQIGGGANSAIVTATGDTTINKGTLKVATNGTLVCNAWLYPGKVANQHGVFLIDGGVVNQDGIYYVSIADVANSSGSMTVTNGGKFSSTTSASTGIVVGMRGTGTLDISDGEMHLTKPFRVSYYSGSSATVRIGAGGLLEIPCIYDAAVGTANLTIDGGTIRAYEDNAAFIPAPANLHVSIGANGATIDTAGHDITIAATLADASGETGKATFTGDGGTVRLTGAANYTGMTYLNEKTHLVVADNTIKSAILSHGLTITKPQGSAKGTYTVLSVAGGACTDADLASVTLGEGLEGATKSIVDGSVVVTVSHTAQTWTGAAETSLP